MDVLELTFIRDYDYLSKVDEISIRRLNLDTSWEMNWDDMSFIIDPWLVGSEVDFFSWFNEQWHIKKPVHPSEIKTPDFILISQSYSDHAHEETLALFDVNIPILCSPKAFKRLSKSLPKHNVIELPILTKKGFYKIGDLRIASIHPGRWLDPVYYAHVVVKNNKAIFYSSHGFEFSKEQSDILNDFDYACLLTSFSEIELPSFMGGKVNPGMSNVNYLLDKLEPKLVLNTHDEQKTHQGVVMKLAKCSYPDYQSISFEKSHFKHVEHYDFISI